MKVSLYMARTEHVYALYVAARAASANAYIAAYATNITSRKANDVDISVADAVEVAYVIAISAAVAF